jgi:hypothetical protein
MATWLDADSYQPSERPVVLHEYYAYGGNISRVPTGPNAQATEFNFENSVTSGKTVEATAVQLCIESALHADGPLSVLVFCPSKAQCETMAEGIRSQFSNMMGEINANYKRVGWRSKTDSYVQGLRSRGHSKKLQACMGSRVAFHHASLGSDERSIVEQAFLQRVCLVICCTSTLAAGVNLPARRVIICNPTMGIETLSRRDYSQMIGRAGRSGLVAFGESYLLIDTKNKEQAKKLLRSDVEPITSGLLKAQPPLGTAASSPSEVVLDHKLLTKIIMELVGSGICVEREQILQFFSNTLCRTIISTTGPPGMISAKMESFELNIKQVIDDLLNGKEIGGVLQQIMDVSTVETAIHVLDEEMRNVGAREKLYVTATQALKRSAYAIVQQQASQTGHSASVLYLSKLGNAAFRGRLDLETAGAMAIELSRLNRGIRFDIPLVRYFLVHIIFLLSL